MALDGEDRGQVTGRVDAEPVTARDRDAFYAAWDLEGQPAERLQRARTDRRSIPLPEHKPVLHSIVRDGSNLWVALYPDGSGGQEWDLISDSGALPGRSNFPEGTLPQVLRGEHLR